MTIGIDESATKLRIVTGCMMKVEGMGWRAYWVKVVDPNTVEIDATKDDETKTFVLDSLGNLK